MTDMRTFPEIAAKKAIGSLVPCQGQVYPECNEHAPTKPLKREDEAFRRSQLGRDCMRHLDQNGVCHAEHCIYGHPQNNDLYPDSEFCRWVRELRQECEVEERRLGVHSFHDNAIAQSLPRRWCWRRARCRYQQTRASQVLD